MPLISILITLILLGVALYLINLIPMDAWIKQVIRVVAILVVVLWLLQALGLFGAFPVVRLR